MQTCGIDEAGRGPLAGPLSVGLVKFTPAILDEIHSGAKLKHLNDSKKLTEKKREYLYSEIMECAELALCQFVSNRHIDQHGINHSIWYAILMLVKKSNLQDPQLLIDGNYNFKSYPGAGTINYESVIKGDEKIASIAAASIIAKVRRDRFMKAIDSKFPVYGFAGHKGYGTARHIQAIRDHGYSRLHRLSYQIEL